MRVYVTILDRGTQAVCDSRFAQTHEVYMGAFKVQHKLQSGVLCASKLITVSDPNKLRLTEQSSSPQWRMQTMSTLINNACVT